MCQKKIYQKTIFFLTFFIILFPTPPVVGLLTTTNTLVAQSNCPGTPPSRMAIGMTGRIAFTDGTTTRLRADATTQADIIFEMPEGLEFVVVGGPECAGNYTWWQLQLSDGTTGWTAEGDDIDYFIEPLPQPVINAPTSAPISQSVNFDTSDQFISFATNDGQVVVVQPDGTVVQRFSATPFTSEMSFICPKISPDGTHVAFAGFFSTRGDRVSPLVLANIATGDVRTLVDNIYGGFDWSPDGTQIAFDKSIRFEPLSDDGIWVVDINNNATRELIPAVAGNPLISPLWSPDGETIAFLEVVYIEGGGTVGTANIDGSSYRTWSADVGAFSWSPDSRQLAYDNVAYGSDNGSIFTADANGISQKLIATFQDSMPVSPKWSPNEQYLAFITANAFGGQYPQSLYIVNVETKSLRRLTEGELQGFDWSPDGTRLIVSVGGQIQIISLDGTVLTTIGQGHCPSWVRTGSAQQTELIMNFSNDANQVFDVQILEPRHNSDGTVTATMVLVSNNSISYGVKFDTYGGQVSGVTVETLSVEEDTVVLTGRVYQSIGEVTFAPGSRLTISLNKFGFSSRDAIGLLWYDVLTALSLIGDLGYFPSLQTSDFSEKTLEVTVETLISQLRNIGFDTGVLVYQFSQDDITGAFTQLAQIIERSPNLFINFLRSEYGITVSSNALKKISTGFAYILTAVKTAPVINDLAFLPREVQVEISLPAA